MTPTRRAALLVLLAALAAGGCGGGCGRGGDPGPSLTEEEKKRQAEELNRERQSEWGKKKGK